MAEAIPTNQIATDDTQTRTSFNDTVIDEYADAYKQGIGLLAIDVCFDNERPTQTLPVCDVVHYWRGVPWTSAAE